jgi:hypothetical protein
MLTGVTVTSQNKKAKVHSEVFFQSTIKCGFYRRHVRGKALVGRFLKRL